MLEVTNMNVFYGNVQVLWDVSFKVVKGEIMAIVGSNGAGKSTTLKAISGLLPASGKIEFERERIDGLAPYRIVEMGISHVPEGRRLFPQMTVLENLKLGAYTKQAKKRRDETLKWVYELFPVLEERKKQLARTLSGGEQQMLAIGRGLMSRPKLLMLDELSLGLAPTVVKSVFKTIEELNRQGVTILAVEQNVRQILTIAKRAYILETGRIVLEGEGKELLDNEHVKRAYLGL